MATGRWAGYTVDDSGYRRILIALFAAGFATFAQLYSTQSLMPEISRDLGISASSAGLSISLATGGLGATVLVWAALADRHGRVAVMKVSSVAATLLALAVPFMPTWEMILGVRLLEGVALGALPALAMAYLGEEIHPRYLAIVAGAFVSGNTVGGLSGRLISGIAGDFLGWRAGLLAVALSCAIAAVAFISVIPEARGFVPTAQRVGAGEHIISQRERLRSALSVPKLWAVYAVGFCGMGAFVSMYSYIGYLLAKPPYSLPTAVTSSIFVIYLFGTVASRAAGKIAFRWGSRRTIVAGFFLMAIGAALTLIPELILTSLGLVVFTYGFFTLSPIAAAITSRLTKHGRAQASALYQLCYYAGSAILGLLLGVVLDAFGWNATVVGILVTVAVGGSIAYFLLRRLPHSDATSQLTAIVPPHH